MKRFFIQLFSHFLVGTKVSYMIYALRRVDLARRLLRLSHQPSPCPRFGLRAQNIEFMFGARLGNMQMREQGKIWRRGSTDRRSGTPANSGMLSPTKRITVSSVLAEGLADNTVILLFGTRADNIRQLYTSRCRPACEGIPGQHSPTPTHHHYNNHHHHHHHQ